MGPEKDTSTPTRGHSHDKREGDSIDIKRHFYDKNVHLSKMIGTLFRERRELMFL